MLQAIVKKGKVIGEKVPAPNVSNSHLLIKVINSCISVGTETSSVKNSSKSLLQKAKEKPEKVKKVFDKIKSDGIKSTRSMVEYELNTGSETGYSISGIIEEVGESVESFDVGDYVAATGAGIANHAEYVNVPVNLACKIPKDLSFENASTVALGAIDVEHEPAGAIVRVGGQGGFQGSRFTVRGKVIGEGGNGYQDKQGQGA